MKTVIAALAFASLSLVAGCKKSGSDCGQVVDHTISLMPAEMQSQIKQGRAEAIAKCEKGSPEARSCALAAKSLEDLMKCPQK